MVNFSLWGYTSLPKYLLNTNCWIRQSLSIPDKPPLTKTRGHAPRCCPSHAQPCPGGVGPGLCRRQKPIIKEYLLMYGVKRFNNLLRLHNHTRIGSIARILTFKIWLSTLKSKLQSLKRKSWNRESRKCVLDMRWNLNLLAGRHTAITTIDIFTIRRDIGGHLKNTTKIKRSAEPEIMLTIPLGLVPQPQLLVAGVVVAAAAAARDTPWPSDANLRSFPHLLSVYSVQQDLGIINLYILTWMSTWVPSKL